MIIMNDIDKDGTHIASLLEHLLFSVYEVNKECFGSENNQCDDATDVEFHEISSERIEE